MSDKEQNEAAKAEAEAKQKADAESAAAKKATAEAAKAEAEERKALTKMSKGDEVSYVHPSTVNSHKAAGWKLVG